MVDFQIIEYLKTPPSPSELKDIASKMGLKPRDFIRKKESIFCDLMIGDILDDEDKLFEIMSQHPKLIERPIAYSTEKAVLGRPPELVLSVV